MEALSELVAEPSNNLETTVLTLDVSHLITEDDTPVDNFLTEKNQRLLTEPLYSSRPTDLRAEKFLVAANVGVYYALREPAIVPDVFFEPGCTDARRMVGQRTALLYAMGIWQAPRSRYRDCLQHHR
jgi:hypothetical protein